MPWAMLALPRGSFAEPGTSLEAAALIAAFVGSDIIECGQKHFTSHWADQPFISGDATREQDLIARPFKHGFVLGKHMVKLDDHPDHCIFEVIRIPGQLARIDPVLDA